MWKDDQRVDCNVMSLGEYISESQSPQQKLDTAEGLKFEEGKFWEKALDLTNQVIGKFIRSVGEEQIRLQQLTQYIIELGLWMKTQEFIMQEQYLFC